METTVLVFFDISNDKLRNKVGEICKDFGLVRIQYSGFMGRLTKNKREELCYKIMDILKDEKAMVIVQPVCEKCAESAFIIGELKTNELPLTEEEKNSDKNKIQNIWDYPFNGIHFTEE